MRKYPSPNSPLIVAPLAGAWIETPVAPVYAPTVIVAPLAGAWIETFFSVVELLDRWSRTPRGCVD